MKNKEHKCLALDNANIIYFADDKIIGDCSAHVFNYIKRSGDCILDIMYCPFCGKRLIWENEPDI